MRRQEEEEEAGVGQRVGRVRRRQERRVRRRTREPEDAATAPSSTLGYSLSSVVDSSVVELRVAESGVAVRVVMGGSRWCMGGFYGHGHSCLIYWVPDMGRQVEIKQTLINTNTGH